MRIALFALTSVAAAALIAGCSAPSMTPSAPPAAAAAPTGPMSFFITSAGSGKGADLCGLAGADEHCQKLAAASGAAGAASKTWRAYLSNTAVPATAPAQPTPAVHARDRIGKGPWFNAKGVMVAADVAQLHASNNLTKATALDEKGNVVNGAGDMPNRHDILTGSRPDGTAFGGPGTFTCGNWTQSGEGSAVIGHHDRRGLVTDPWALSWNSSHQTRGCSQEALVSTGGAGLFYCFAAN
jgi:hypothetical protein